MTKKITKDFLRETIKNVLKGMMNEDVTAKFSDAEKSSIRNSKSRVDAEKKARALLMRKGMSSAAASRAAAQVARAHSFYGVSDEPGIAGTQRKEKADIAARRAAVRDKTMLKFLGEPEPDDPQFTAAAVQKAFKNAKGPGDFESQDEKDRKAQQARMDRIANQSRSVAVKQGETPAMARAREDEEERRRKGMVAPEKPTIPGTGLKEEEDLEEGSCSKVDDEDVQEEAKSQEEFAKNQPPYDKATAADRAGDDGKNKSEKSEKKSNPPKSEENPSESKIRTPEQEKTLYEQRFTPKNERLYQKLLKEWAK